MTGMVVWCEAKFAAAAEGRVGRDFFSASGTYPVSSVTTVTTPRKAWSDGPSRHDGFP